MVVITFRCRKFITPRVRCGLLAKTWLSMWGTTTISMISLWYLCPLRRPCNHAKRIPNPSQKPHQMEWFPGSIGGSIWLPPNTSFSISHMQKKAAFIGPMNLSPWCKIPSVAYLTPCQTCCFTDVRRGRLIDLLVRCTHTHTHTHTHTWGYNCIPLYHCPQNSSNVCRHIFASDTLWKSVGETETKTWTWKKWELWSGICIKIEWFPRKYTNAWSTHLVRIPLLKKWTANFKLGRDSIEEDPRSGRPKSATTDDQVEVIHRMVMKDRRVTVQHSGSHGHQCWLSSRCFDWHPGDELPVCKMGALNVDARSNVEQNGNVNDTFGLFPAKFLRRSVIQDETWIHHFDLEWKNES